MIKVGTKVPIRYGNSPALAEIVYSDNAVVEYIFPFNAYRLGFLAKVFHFHMREVETHEAFKKRMLVDPEEL